MILNLAWYEFVMLVRERRTLWMMVAIAALVVLSFASLTYEQVRADTAKQSVSQSERARWLNQGEKDPHSAAHYSVYAFKPAPALAALDPGIEQFVGQAVWLEAHVQNDMLQRPLGEASVLQRAGLINPTALLITLAPLIAFVMAFGLIARERERGTLRLALGAAGRAGHIIASKALLMWVAMMVLLVLPVALAACWSAAARDLFAFDVAVRLATWCAMMAAYFALLVLIGLAITTRCVDTRAALAGLFGAWMLFIVAMPRALTGVVEAAAPLPATQQVRQQIKEEAPVYWSAEVSRARQEQLLAQYGVARKEDLPIDERGAQLDIAERHSHAVFDRVLGRFYDQVQAQDSKFAALSALSPAAVVQSISQALAGTDFAHHRQFIRSAETYRRALVNRMNAEVKSHALNTGGPRHQAGAQLWREIPEFTYHPPTLAAGWGPAWAAVAALCAWLVAAVVLIAYASRGLRP